jgi:tRNA 2-selenouridine synthase
MRDSIKVWCSASMETRVSRLIDEYGRPEFKDGMVIALDRIIKKLGGDNHGELMGYLEQWELEPFMAGLMEKYYDRTYYKTREWTEDFALSLEDYETAAEELERQLNRRF